MLKCNKKMGNAGLDLYVIECVLVSEYRRAQLFGRIGFSPCGTARGEGSTQILRNGNTFLSICDCLSSVLKRKKKLKERKKKINIWDTFNRSLVLAERKRETFHH